jgi:hypothetical protein
MTHARQPFEDLARDCGKMEVRRHNRFKSWLSVLVYGHSVCLGISSAIEHLSNGDVRLQIFFSDNRPYEGGKDTTEVKCDCRQLNVSAGCSDGPKLRLAESR